VLQQAWFMPPQAVHIAIVPLFVQAKPLLQLAPRKPAPAQHTWPDPPQGLQVPPIPLLEPTQVPPGWQMSPAQQPPLTAPQASQVRGPPAGMAHASPVEQPSLPQQVSPMPPHVSHEVTIPLAPITVWHERPSVHVSPPPPPEQHAPPLPPHEMHMPVAQRAPAPVHVPPPPPPPQHGCPIAPHAIPAALRHEPFMHVPVVPFPPMHALPDPTH
jgi:hypothetical protein